MSGVGGDDVVLIVLEESVALMSRAPGQKRPDLPSWLDLGYLNSLASHISKLLSLYALGSREILALEDLQGHS